MGIYVPQMQQRFTGYTSGQNTARNLLDAVRMKNEMERQRKEIESREGMQTKQIEATDKLTSKELRTRYNIAKMGDKTERDLAADSNQLARDLQSGKLDWQNLDREDRQMFEKLAQQRGFINAESMLRTELDAQAERQDKDIAFRDRDLEFRREMGRGQLGLSKNRLRFDKEMGRGRLDLDQQRFGLDQDRFDLQAELGRGQLDLGKSRLDWDKVYGGGRLALDTSRLAQQGAQFNRSLDERARQFDLNFGEDQRQFNVLDRYRSSAEKRIADDHARRVATMRAESALAKDKAREIDEAEIYEKEINRGIEDTNFFQGIIDSFPFTRSTQERVTDEVYERGGPPFEAFSPSYYYNQAPNAVLSSDNLLNIMNNPLYMSDRRALDMQKLSPLR